MSVSISKGNRKVGAIANFSLPPIKACPAVCVGTCAKNCYALKSYRMYPTVKKAWDRNLEEVSSSEAWADDVCKFLDGYKGDLFRIHVAGDFISQEYFMEWVRIARQYNGIQFLAFTKCYDIADGIRLPQNFNLIYSLWDGIDPTSAPVGSFVSVVGESDDPPAHLFKCGGYCPECKACFHVKELEAIGYNGIYFKKH